MGELESLTLRRVPRRDVQEAARARMARGSGTLPRCERLGRRRATESRPGIALTHL